ncbi:MAG: 3,4-dihydroxy-2-butanone-4-phosphate synthase [Saezia sp.]
MSTVSETCTCTLCDSSVSADFMDAAIERVESAIQALQQGKMILVQDDENRENEADLIAAAENMSDQDMAMMIRDCSGIVCLCLPEEFTRALGLRPMVECNESKNHTAVTVTIEALDGVTTGVRAKDRMTTIQAALNSTPENKLFVSPGHVFPLAAKAGGVLERRGHTEASIDFARLAGFRPAGVLCELTNPDGTMAVGAQVEDYAKKYDLVLVSVEDLAIYRQCMNC